MKILYIGYQIGSIRSGADQVNQRNQDVLSLIFEEAYLLIEPTNKRGFFSRYQWGSSDEFISRLYCLIDKEKVETVFLSQSLYGYVAKRIKKKYSQIKIISFFHNIEIQYAQEAIKQGFRHYPFYLAAKYAESLCVKNSDFCIVLNDRDALLLKRFYHKKADLILPTSFKDKFDVGGSSFDVVSNTVTYLFVGVAFFANIEGVKWFINYVLPFVPGNLIVIGKDMDKYSKELSSERVLVLGYVEDLSFYYYNATFVISPIFSGGGMKTKTAEALMYGKTIIGTSEAFEGYILNSGATYVCNTDKEFICVIQRLIKNVKLHPFNSISRTLFEKYYSFESSRLTLSNFIDSINL